MRKPPADFVLDVLDSAEEVKPREDAPAEASSGAAGAEKRRAPRTLERPVKGFPEPVRAGGWIPLGLGDELGLPPDCPVMPLGKDGDVFFFLDPLGQLRALKASEMGQAGLAALFAPHNEFLYWAWPRFSRSGDLDGWKADRARDCLMAACAKRGVWRAFARVRGRGAWREDDGTLTLHCGDELVRVAGSEPPGQRRDFVYPAGVKTLKPHGSKVGTDPADDLLKLFRTWRWRRPFDAELLVGWICAALLGGALDWRPLIFIVGDRQTGKSTLQRVIGEVLGPDGLIQAAETSAAGIYQHVGHDSLPIAIDELEADADGRKVEAVVKLARLASSGGLMLRGGADHKGVEFMSRSCYMFSAINPPPLRPQDRSRMALLELRPFQKGDPEPVIDVEDMRAIGRKLRRRLLDYWGELPVRLEAFRATLKEAGHAGRGADQFGALLACGDLALANAPPDFGTLQEWQERLAPDLMVEFDDAEPNWKRCLDHLMSRQVDAWGRERISTIGAALGQLRGAAIADEAARIRDLNLRLGQVGLAVVSARGGERGPGRELGGYWLAIPTSDAKLQKHFEGTDWGGSPSAGGVWTSAIRQAPDEVWRNDRAYIDGAQRRCILVDLERVMNPEEAA